MQYRVARVSARRRGQGARLLASNSEVSNERGRYCKRQGTVWRKESICTLKCRRTRLTSTSSLCQQLHARCVFCRFGAQTPSCLNARLQPGLSSLSIGRSSFMHIIRSPVMPGLEASVLLDRVVSFSSPRRSTTRVSPRRARLSSIARFEDWAVSRSVSCLCQDRRSVTVDVVVRSRQPPTPSSERTDRLSRCRC